MTLNQLIQYSKENDIDFDKPIVQLHRGMEYTSYNPIKSINEVKLEEVNQTCTDSFDGQRYNTALLKKTINGKSYLEIK